MVLADNGGGPLAHIVNGKDNGASVEMSWIVDDRSRDEVPMSDMADMAFFVWQIQLHPKLGNRYGSSSRYKRYGFEWIGQLSVI
jgi:hypothetical protein